MMRAGVPVADPATWLQIERLDTHDAVVLRDHSSEFRWREPARAQPLQVSVGRPTGDGTALSDEDGDLVVKEFLKELSRRWDADPLEALCVLARDELRAVADKRDCALLPLIDGTVRCDVERKRRPGRVGCPSACEIEDLHAVRL